MALLNGPEVLALRGKGTARLRQLLPLLDGSRSLTSIGATLGVPLESVANVLTILDRADLRLSALTRRSAARTAVRIGILGRPLLRTLTRQALQDSDCTVVWASPLWAMPPGPPADLTVTLVVRDRHREANNVPALIERVRGPSMLFLMDSMTMSFGPADVGSSVSDDTRSDPPTPPVHTLTTWAALAALEVLSAVDANLAAPSLQQGTYRREE